ncbi:alpha/beta hydrolase-fold protein [Georgenia satyanarayanai]|uniref:alpha/beta hydrolase-fold protein n=1 Tax=Georgenia satyanarayanai TaxID=860221 RepID=UPI00203E16AB|nr:alpha/beta hydrolase-fold protein [Georgenia satyanarayanai]MCM3659725.1 alpha/beta hydrolase-fold protein [Georgenia satyanarayanai]
MSSARLSRRLAVTAAVAVVAGASLTLPALAAEQGTLVPAEATGTAAGTVDYTVYLPPGYDDSTDRYPTVYLLHGRGDTQAAWQRVATDLDELITSGELQPVVAVMPDAPWNDRGSWYTDSLYTGDAASGPGLPVETALAEDLVEHVDATYRTVAHREARAVGGYSMGGAGALRVALAHQEDFSAGIVLSPAAYVPQPPADSSVRDYGAYGVGDALFDADRYTELSYPTALESLDPALPVHLFVAVGDDEWPNPDPAEAQHDIDLESAQLYNTARRVPGVTAELRVLDGGHDWDVWQPAFREAIVDVGQRLRTEPAATWDAELLGSAGDDRAGGIVETADGGSVVALNLAGAWDGYEPAGGMDTLLVRRAADGTEAWRHAIATGANDRAYGVVNGADDGVLVAGYTRGTLATGEADTQDDAFVAAVDAAGERTWTLELGDPGAADRFYAIAPDGDGGAYVAGYTSGSFAGTPSAGDKDAVLARVSAGGELLWSTQLGGSGEDKAMAVALTSDGDVVVGGVSGAGLPGAEHLGSGDGWVARYDADGEQQWVRAVATAENDMVSGLVPLADGAVLAVGQTKGVLGEAALGDNDIVVRALTADGEESWTLQTGTSTDDRGVTGVATADGGALVLATTYGAMGEPLGGVDVVALPVSADGVAGEPLQLGSRDRDGADEWDEANLFAAPGTEGTWLSGLTFGAPDGAVNAGAGDVFVMRLASTPGEEPTEEPTTAEPSEPEPEPEPTVTPGEPSSPEPTVTPTDGPAPTDGPGSESPEPSATPVPPVTDTASGAGGLPSTGAAVIGAAVLALLLAAAGAVLVARRRGVAA